MRTGNGIDPASPVSPLIMASPKSTVTTGSRADIAVGAAITTR